MKEVCILIPTLNEEESIGEVIKEFKKLGFTNIFVIDGHSTDATREIAEREGARVVVQKGKGKGTAVRQAFDLIDDDVLVMIDGDGTYSPAEVNTLLAPILTDEADHVIGNRFGFGGSFSPLHRFGNWTLNRVFWLGYGIKLHDILSGYRALTKDCVSKLDLEKEGFEIEAEMAIKSVKQGIRMKEVPISYQTRKGKAKLNTFRDGFKILYTLYMLAKSHNPLFYFGILGTFFIIAGVLSGLYVVLEWYEGVTHILLTVFTALLIISGVQFFILGLLGDLLVTIQKDTIELLLDRVMKK
jgi:glycosyltransferase (TIGR04182 family)